MTKPNADQPSVIHADFEKPDVLEDDLAAGASQGTLVNRVENLKFVGESVDAIGFGKFQWQLTLTCAFGFIADQMLLISISLITPQVAMEFGPRYPTLLLAAQSAGLLIGAVVLGILADNLGRRLVWQVSIFGVSIMAMVMASAPNWTALNCFLALAGFFGGGNLAIDLTILAESIPSNWSFVLSGLAIVWGVGNAVTGLIAWPLLVEIGCPNGSTPETCSKAENMGWRYLYITLGALCFVMALIRAFVLRTTESPRWLVACGRQDEAVAVLNHIATMNGSDYRVEADQFIPDDGEAAKTASFRENMQRLTRLFSGGRQIWLMSCLVLIWFLIGIAYPLYTVFLPYYLAAHGASLGDESKETTYRDWVVSSVVGIFGPMLSMWMVSNKWLRSRKSMMITGAACTAFSGAFTYVSSPGENLAFSSMITFSLNSLYAIIYSYTPQALPVENRGLGNGLLMATCRFSALIVPFIATFADVTSAAPIWVSCGCYIAIGITAIVLPIDTVPFKRQQ